MSEAKILDFIKSTDRIYATVRDWGKDAVNGYLKIDMGKMVTLKMLIKSLPLSESTIRRSIKKLQAKKKINVHGDGWYCPMCISLIEQPLETTDQ